ncbi:hypothetical protein [Allosediminivita pacifica]|uniref:Uncharacterized protein n=1 Tax=Allosediminivita pacifica TaxID=1267769 RepID=A0A2T6AB51_9RHOB|nr:hypothetical protein [Allosediminivita pacifica]PTX41029.1 hypothetical protein C8N44_1332 [Allosediminivita pacifica]GGB26172.1 hypothetical protein GCM10011324_39980 [Allosediminivita pacifica]
MKESGAPIRPFPASGGDCAAILEAIDWDAHPLGEPANWPVELKTVVRTCLTSKFASMVHWDDALFTFYNDAYATAMVASPSAEPLIFSSRSSSPSPAAS